MNKLYELVQSEYTIEYINNYKPEGIMPKKIFYTPKIYPKIIADKRLSAFTEKEKKEILQKYKRWYVYYYFRNHEDKMVKQPSIFYKVNQKNKDFDSRYTEIHSLRRIMENILKNGFTPIKDYSEDNNHPQYTTASAIEFTLNLKKSMVSENTFKDYKFRVEKFQEWLKNKGLDKIPITSIAKKDINDFLNSILTRYAFKEINKKVVHLVKKPYI